ncbi:MAG: hypothetical protein Q9191_008582, partial [Dirinaria sp. TL-2023a]
KMLGPSSGCPLADEYPSLEACLDGTALEHVPVSSRICLPVVVQASSKVDAVEEHLKETRRSDVGLALGWMAPFGFDHRID